VEHLLTNAKSDLHFDEKFCIFVIQIWGIAKTQVIPLYFAYFSTEKSQDFLKISRRLVEKSQGFVEIFLRFV
jgi:hypothetical protein